MNVRICHLDGNIEMIENAKVSLLTRDGLLKITLYDPDKKPKSVRNYILSHLLYYETSSDEEKIVDGCGEENSLGWREKQLKDLEAEIRSLAIAENIARACSVPSMITPSVTHQSPCERDRWK